MADMDTRTADERTAVTALGEVLLSWRYLLGGALLGLIAGMALIWLAFWTNNVDGRPSFYSFLQTPYRETLVGTVLGQLAEGVLLGVGLLAVVGLLLLVRSLERRVVEPYYRGDAPDRG